MPLFHLDTDLGGDIDDLCALALLLRSPDVELAGVTTVGEIDGQRAGYVRYALRLEGRDDIPVAAGADNALGRFRARMGLPPEERYWPEPVAPAPGPLEDALDLLKQSIEQGATVVAIGPYTNLHLLDMRYPGILAQAKLYLMGGYVYPPRAGFPQWQNEDDYNVQTDVAAARHVPNKASPTLIPLSITAETALRRGDPPVLHAAGVGRSDRTPGGGVRPRRAARGDLTAKAALASRPTSSTSSMTRWPAPRRLAGERASRSRNCGCVRK